MDHTREALREHDERVAEDEEETRAHHPPGQHDAPEEGQPRPTDSDDE
jgi:hypothetical protein